MKPLATKQVPPARHLDADRRKVFRELVERLGLAEACRQIGVSREAGARLLALIDVHAGTVALAANGIDALITPEAAQA